MYGVSSVGCEGRCVSSAPNQGLLFGMHANWVSPPRRWWTSSWMRVFGRSSSTGASVRRSYGCARAIPCVWMWDVKDPCGLPLLVAQRKGGKCRLILDPVRDSQAHTCCGWLRPRALILLSLLSHLVPPPPPPPPQYHQHHHHHHHHHHHAHFQRVIRSTSGAAVSSS